MAKRIMSLEPGNPETGQLRREYVSFMKGVVSTLFFYFILISLNYFVFFLIINFMLMNLFVVLV